MISFIGVIPMLWEETNGRIDRATHELMIYVKNTAPKAIDYRLRDVTWNWCPVKGVMPVKFSLAKGKSRTFRFKPGNSDVLRWGEVIGFRLQRYAGGTMLGEHNSAPGPTWGNPSVGVWQKDGGTILGLTTPTGVPPCQIRDFRLTLNGKSIHGGVFTKSFVAWVPNGPANGPTKRPAGIYEFPESSNVLLWSSPAKFRPGSVTYAFSWRQSPWAPWIKVKEAF